MLVENVEPWATVWAFCNAAKKVEGTALEKGSSHSKSRC